MVGDLGMRLFAHICTLLENGVLHNRQQLQCAGIAWKSASVNEQLSYGPGHFVLRYNIEV